MNQLFRYSYTDLDRGMPAFAWDVFGAFDRGEYRDAEDPAGAEPWQIHTLPMIREILSRGDVD